VKIAAVIVAAGFLSGCAMAPGMGMDEGAAEARGRFTQIVPTVQALYDAAITVDVARRVR